MTWPWLSEVIEHRLVVDDAEIAPAPDAVVRAIDVRGRFAAVYMLSVDERGRWSDDCLIAWKYRGGWESPSSGGAHGEREPPPWRRPTKWWKGRAFGLSGIAGCELPLDDDGEEMVLVRGLYGIATTVAASKSSTAVARIPPRSPPPADSPPSPLVTKRWRCSRLTPKRDRSVRPSQRSLGHDARLDSIDPVVSVGRLVPASRYPYVPQPRSLRRPEPAL